MALQVTSSIPLRQYTGNGSQTVFQVPFEFRQNSDVVVRVADAIVTNYTLTGAGVTGGGSLTFTVAPANGATVVIYGNMAIERGSEQYAQYGPLPAAVLEADLDNFTMREKQLARDIGRSIHLQPYDTADASSFVLPLAATRRGRILRFADTATAPLELATSIGATVLSADVIGKLVDPATAREIAKPLVPVFRHRAPGDIRRYDGRGDGSHDDTQAFLDGIGTRDEIWLQPDGVYMVGALGAALANNQRLIIHGNGATLKLIDNTNAQMMKHANVANGTMARLQFDDLVFDGNKANQSAYIESLIDGYFDEFVARGCKIQNAKGINFFLRHISSFADIGSCRWKDGAEHTGTLNEESGYLGIKMDPARPITGLRYVSVHDFVMEGIVPGVAGRGVYGIIASDGSTMTEYQSHILNVGPGRLLNCGQNAAGNVVAAVKIYRRASQSMVHHLVIDGGQDNGVEVQGSDDVTVDTVTVRNLTGADSAAIEWGPRDGDKTCRNMVVRNPNIYGCVVGVRAHFAETLHGRDFRLEGGQIENVQQAVRATYVEGKIFIGGGLKLRTITDDAPTVHKHAIAIGVSSTDTDINVDVELDDIQIDDSQNIIARIRDCIGTLTIGNIQSRTIEDIRSISVANHTGDIEVHDCNLAGVINDVLEFDTVTGRIHVLDNIAPAGATVRLAGGSVIGLSRNNSWDQDLQGSATFNPSSLADGAGETTTVTVTGAVLGDFAEASFSLDLQGITLTAWVAAANTVSVRFQNESGGVLDLASGTLRARVRRQ